MTTSHRAIIIATVMYAAVSCAAVEMPTERDAQAIRATVQAHTPEIIECYHNLLEQDPDAGGRVVASFTILPSGAVSDASVEVNELGSPEMESCVVGSVSSWSFEAIDGDETPVSYPFTFRPREESTPAPAQVETLDAATIRGVFSAAQAETRRCYNSALEQDSELEGQINARLTISEDGTVSQLNLEDATLDNAALTACLEQHISSLVFPAHQGGDQEVSYPLVFRASN